MKKMVKTYGVLAGLAICLTLGGVGTLNAVDANAETASLQMQEGASLLLKEESGLMFSYEISDYDASKNYGMLIVPYDYLAKAGISLTDETADDFVTALNAAKESGVIAYEPIVKENLEATQQGEKWIVKYSVKNIKEQNYVREYFGIGFEKS